MQLTIHRGTREIGGTCIEVSTTNTRILLDVGLPLFDAQRQPLDGWLLQSQSNAELIHSGILPPVAGLLDGKASPDAILLSHAHLDHCGLLARTALHIPVYATSGTSKMMLAGSIFAGQTGIPRERFQPLRPKTSIKIGDFQVTPFAVDHSIFGAVALLVEAEGQSLWVIRLKRARVDKKGGHAVSDWCYFMTPFRKGSACPQVYCITVLAFAATVT